MPSFPKLLARPRLQLLVLMLVLVAGLSPKNSMAQDEAPVSPDAGASPTADDAAGRSADEPGQADKPAIKCFDVSCGGGGCISLADDGGTKKTDCSRGYCYQAIFKYKRKDRTTKDKEVDVAQARFGCASEHHVRCLKRHPGNCTKISHFGESKDVDRLTIFAVNRQCLDEAEGGFKGNVNGKPGFKTNISMDICVCDKDLCNTGEERRSLSSGPAGPNHLGYNDALVGALLVSAFNLRSLFPVG